MRGESLVQTQLLMAQAIQALAEHVKASTGFMFAPVAYAARPGAPPAGTVACFIDSTVNAWGGVVAGGGTYTVLAFYNGTAWKVIAA